jgi:glycosyltransferase involved in cell wall biosynthesis
MEIEMNLVIEKSVTVITPTIGKPELKDAIKSVKNQTYKCKHLIVVDGEEHWRSACLYVDEMSTNGASFSITPENTGANGFYGHRIYAAYPHLINSDYILFLDEDNCYEPTHVETLIKTIEENNLDFAYSLRKIYDVNLQFLCRDDCESLGKFPIYFTRGTGNPQFLIDTSSFCFKREFIQETCHLWHSGWGGDRRYLSLIYNHAKFATSGKYTLCYRLDGNPNSVTKEFFEEGNKIQAQYYKGAFPWRK